MKLTKDREHLVLENQGLIYSCLKKLQIKQSDPDYEDFASIGKIGLVKAAIYYNPEEGVVFSTYAVTTIHNELCNYFQRGQKSVKAISYDTVIGGEDDSIPYTIQDKIIDKHDLYEQVEDADECAWMLGIILNSLQNDRRMVLLYRLGNQTLQQIADKMNLTRQRIGQIEEEARGAVQKASKSPQTSRQKFSMRIDDEGYQFSFYSKNAEQIEQIVELLQKLIFAEDLPNFKVSYTKEQVVAHLPAQPESFVIIARITQEIEQFQAWYALKNKKGWCVKK